MTTELRALLSEVHQNNNNTTSYHQEILKSKVVTIADYKEIVQYRKDFNETIKHIVTDQDLWDNSYSDLEKMLEKLTEEDNDLEV